LNSIIIQSHWNCEICVKSQITVVAVLVSKYKVIRWPSEAATARMFYPIKIGDVDV